MAIVMWLLLALLLIAVPVGVCSYFGDF